jgi:hypothetical protein
MAGNLFGSGWVRNLRAAACFNSCIIVNHAILEPSSGGAKSHNLTRAPNHTPDTLGTVGQ